MSFDHTEILSWSRLTGSDLEPWEVKALISASRVYDSSIIKYRDKKYNLNPPYDGRTIEQKRKDVVDKFKRMFKD